MNITSCTEIIHVSFEAYPYHFGGIGTIVYQLVKYALKFKTYLIAPFNKNKQETINFPNGSVIYFLPTKITDKKIDFNSFIFQTQLLIHSLKKAHPEIDYKIHIHDWKLIFLERYNIPISYLTFHKYEKLSTKETKYIERKIPNIIFVSKTLQKQIKHFHKNYFIVYNGIEIKAKEKKLEKINKKNQYRIGFVGRYEKEKGFDYFLKCTKIKDKRFTFVCCGDGSLKDKLNECCEDHGFLKDEKLQAFYDSLDLLIVPSRKDSFNLVIPEAINNQIPVIVSTIPSFRELYSNNKFVSFYNFKFFCKQSLSKIIENSILKNDLSKVSDFYDIKTTITNYEVLYAGN